MPVIIRTDASSTVGSGHVMRCLTLAHCLRSRGADVVFAMRSLSGDLGDRVRSNGFPVLELAKHLKDAEIDEEADAEIFLAAIEDANGVESAAGGRADWVIVDHYQLGKAWEKKARLAASRLLAIDDLANRAHDADVLLDQNLVEDYEGRYGKLVRDDCLTLLGPEYALLSGQYRHVRETLPSRCGRIRKILVYFGGADRAMASMTVDALSRVPGEFAVLVVLDAANPQAEQLRAKTAADARISISGQLPDLANVMAEADLFIGASGTTSWERLCLGLKAVVVTMADNQEPLARELDRLGFIDWIGRSDTITPEILAKSLQQFVTTPVDGAVTARMMRTVDGLGAERVADVLWFRGGEGLVLRKAQSGDIDLVLSWANDPETRRHAFNTRPISRDEHSVWFERRINSPEVKFFIAETPNGIPAGQVRFECQADNAWEISYLIAPVFRGRGLARPMLETAVRTLFEDAEIKVVSGYVKPENVASVRVFEGLGFHCVADQETVAARRYELRRPLQRLEY